MNTGPSTIDKMEIPPHSPSSRDAAPPFLLINKQVFLQPNTHSLAKAAAFTCLPLPLKIVLVCP